MKKKVYFLTFLFIALTSILTMSLSTYQSWNQLVEEKQNDTKSIAQYLEKQINQTYIRDILQNRKLSKQEKIEKLNHYYQPIVEDITQSFPQYGAGYYIKDLDSIVAFGPNFKKEGLKDIRPDSPAREVYKTKGPIWFDEVSQTRQGHVVAHMRPIIIDGKVIGHVWGNVLVQDVWAIFNKKISTYVLILVSMLLVGWIGTTIILRQYTKELKVFTNRVIRPDLDTQDRPDFLPELVGVYKEVVDARKKVVESERRFRDVVNAFDEYVFEVDLNARYTYVSNRVIAILGYMPEEMIGMTVFDYIACVDENEMKKIFFEVAKNKERLHNIEHRKYTKENELKWLKSSAVPIFNEKGTLVGYRGATRDISIQKQAEESLTFLAYHDPLTQLYNRLGFDQKLDQYIKQAKGTPFTVLFLDLDRFKMVNDSLGHDIGDQLLREVAIRIQSCREKEAIFARFGGDEFTIILPYVHEEKQIRKYLDHLIQAVTNPYNLKDRKFFITVSIGVVMYPEHGKDSVTLIRNADVAMYHAKDLGRNQYQFYTERLNEKAVENLTLKNELHQALERNEFILYYQPQISLTNGKVIGAEALIRWNHPRYGMISPGRFIPIAEKAGLIIPIGNWVLKTACLQNKRWQEEGYKPVTIAVNISIEQFRQEHFVENISLILKETKLDPKFLELEITESMAMYNVDNVIEKLRALKELGVLFAIDDFGKEYSSLTYLKSLPIDQLKIDRSFIENVSEDEKNKSIVKSIIDLGHLLQLHVIAEGVETEEQRQFLIENNCDKAQGFLYSKPIPTEDFASLIKSVEMI